MFELDEIPNYADVMTMEEFKNLCKVGGFIDYDGYGYYAFSLKEMTYIIVNPSDVINGTVDDSFPLVAWFNR